MGSIPKPRMIRSRSRQASPGTLQPLAALLAKVIEHTQQRERIGLGRERDRLTRAESPTQPLRRRLVAVQRAVDPMALKPSNKNVRVRSSDPDVAISDEEYNRLVRHPARSIRTGSTSHPNRRGKAIEKIAADRATLHSVPMSSVGPRLLVN
jgi:hypothetical protein